MTKKIYIIIIMAVLIFAGTAYAGLHETEWCSSDGYCHAFYDGDIYIRKDAASDYRTGYLYYIDFNGLYMAYSDPQLISSGLAVIFVGIYSLSTEILTYWGGGIIDYQLAYGGRTLWLSGNNWNPWDDETTSTTTTTPTSSSSSSIGGSSSSTTTTSSDSITTTTISEATTTSSISSGEEDLEPIIPNTTKIISESSTDLLESVSDDYSILTFSDSTPELESLSSGDVIIADITSITPYGLLRKVYETYKSGGKFVVVTTEATLEDALEQGTVKVTIDLNPSDIQSFKALKKGVFLKQLANNLSEEEQITIGLEHVDLGEGVEVSGYIAFIPSIDFKANFKWFTMVSAHLISKVTEEFKLELTASVEGSYSYALEPPLAIMTFPTIVVLVGGIPVTFTPEIYVNAGISGEVSAKVTTGVYQTASLTAGIEYKDGMWTDSITPDYTFEKTPLSVEAQAQVTAYAGPELRVKIWKEPSLIIDLRGNVSLMAEACEQEGQIIGITGEITAGAELILGLKFDKLSKLIADQTMTVWEPDSIVIYEFPECGEGAVCCTCTIPPDVGLFDVPLPYCLSVDQYNLEGCFPELTTFECGGTFFNTYNECLGGCFITP